MKHYNAVITGASRGLGWFIKDQLENRNDLSANVMGFSRTSGYDLTTDGGLNAAKNYIENNIPDILILNAGSWKNNWRLNYESPKALAEKMPKNKLVVFVLSNAAYQSYGNDDYTASKCGLLHYARRKQREGFIFATIAPGTIDTGFWEGAEVDNRKRGAMQPETVAASVLHIIKAYESGALVKEMIITPCL